MFFFMSFFLFQKSVYLSALYVNVYLFVSIIRAKSMYFLDNFFFLYHFLLSSTVFASFFAGISLISIVLTVSFTYIIFYLYLRIS